MSPAGGGRPLLEPGATVGVVATGFAVRPPALRSGVRRLERMGYRVALGEHVLARCGYLAGDDDARAADLCAMLSDPDVAAVWFARGGYGTARLLDRIPWRRLARRPKLLVGYSDLTALFGAIAGRSAGRCLYGPVVAELGQESAYDRSSLERLLAGLPVKLRIRRAQVLAHGRARGRLLGGNLTVLAHLLGTPHAPDLRGAVLFLEDVGEETYRIDRALTQLAAAGALRGVAGVLLGSFLPPPRRAFPPDRVLDDVLGERFLPFGVPVIRDVPAGHVAGKWTLPLGGIAEIDTAAGQVRLLP
jgi:muramoyltetrapeptide carboxypeptidase